VIRKHVRNVFSQGELAEESNAQNLRISTDGNKRIGSLLFVHFLDKNGCLSRPDDSHRFDANALVAVALLVAQGDPKQKDMVMRLIMAMLS
jgi:hypothetical protein